MSSHQDFGATIGRGLVEAGADESVPKVAAAQFVAGVLDVHSGVKLPALLGSDAVREWMERVGVSGSMLRTALTDARRAYRENALKDPAVRVPPRSRKKRGANRSSEDGAKAISPADRPKHVEVVPNQSLDLL